MFIPEKHQLAVLYQVIITSIIILSIVIIVSFIAILIIRRQCEIQKNCEYHYPCMKTDHTIISNSIFSYLVLLQSKQSNEDTYYEEVTGKITVEQDLVSGLYKILQIY